MTKIGNSIDSTRTRIGQEEQQDSTSSTRRDYNYNYNYPARARAREASAASELPPAEIMQKIAEAYRDNISQQITKVAAGIIERALTNGMEPATVILAIEETGMASRPSPYYLSAILRRWAEFGVVCSRSHGGPNLEISTTQARPWWR